MFSSRCLLLLLLLCFQSLLLAESTQLREHLREAQVGDYFVILSAKTETLMLIRDKNSKLLAIEEIAVPVQRGPRSISWREWVQKNAPGNTSWVMYDIDLDTGEMVRYYSFTKNGWYDIPEADNFISKLLNLKLTLIPDDSRKRIGSKPAFGVDPRPIWQPRLVFEGQMIPKATFTAWKTRWPRDQSDLSGKMIEVYLPTSECSAPSYFPYWVQIEGTIGNAKIRVIDSGKGLISQKPSLNQLMQNKGLFNEMN